MPGEAARTTLTTERLILRPQRVEDAAVFRQLWADRDLRVPPHRRIDQEGRPTEADIVSHIREAADDERPGLMTVTSRTTGEVIGYSGLVFDSTRRLAGPELAFELLLAMHNRGYATEAGRAVVEWAREAGHPRLWATVWDWNVASRRVLEKLGFVETGRVTKENEHGRSLLTVRDTAE
jgi:RimJ/RimL family protein N-acetyltransferase